jgi:hypothetical protein
LVKRRRLSLAGQLLKHRSGVSFVQPDAEAGSDVVREVLSYFVRNPKATDSIEGVARWRLLEEQVYRTVQETETALAFLVSRGFLEEIPTSGHAKVFRLEPKRLADAVRFLAQQGASKKRP